MKVAILAGSQSFSYNQGMHDFTIEEVNDIEEANEIGAEIQKILAESNSCFRFQEGDDDFFSMGKNSTNLLNHSFAKNIMEW